ncbi:TPA: hypothetical protein NG630_003150 [Vibrio parahaemolyticus]|uniref:hypothetical protein n=1 Tax=Vibrio parahaemolyticus TaxID=670 RepID=UPI00301D55E2|nr:hypothetical protein [Vibrio parahaemolyticus]MDG2868466.1 hypothetical protein [Vibrio parahaemolyticus]HCE3510895.1 hypothetical protein [Vibrio parahaemolyticus]
MEAHSKFVRVSIYVLAIFIAGLIVSGFVLGEPSYQISPEIITMVLIILILFLSESFNSLSLGKLVTLSREKKEKEKENSGLKAENSELRNQLITVATNVNQSQVTYNGVSNELLKSLNVVPADEAQKAAKGRLETDDDNVPEQKQPKVSRKDPELTALQKLVPNGTSKMRLMRDLEPNSIVQVCNRIGIDSNGVRHEVRFASAFEGLDPIMENSVVFDAYYQLEEKELFFEVMRSDMLRPDRFNYLYQMLTKLFLYRKAKSVSAELVLILVELPEEIQSRTWGDRIIERLQSQFAPAVANKLLRIETVKYEEQAIVDILNSAKK